MVYTEWERFDAVFTGILAFGTAGIGILVLLVFKLIGDRVAHDHADMHDEEVVGRCETCGELVREGVASRVYVRELDREVLVCPFGRRCLVRDRLNSPDEDEVELALEAIETPMWIKRWSM